jgi:Domain of unknown function (DUF4386)
MNTVSVQRYARTAGALVVISILAGAFSELYVPSILLVPADLSATARNLEAHDFLLRASFAIYLVEATCDITLTLIFYYLLKPMSKELALLAAFFGLVSTATFAFAELFYFASSFSATGGSLAEILPPDQRRIFTMLSLTLYGYGGSIFMVFYGIASILRGYLISRSKYLPRFLGVLLVFGGLGFVVKNFALVLAPRFDSDYFLLPMFVAQLPLAAWLLLRDVNTAVWETRSIVRGAPA